MPDSQLRRSLAVTEKDIRIYYLKGPVLIFGILFPMFLFLAFSVGRSIPLDIMISGLLSMTLVLHSNGSFANYPPLGRKRGNAGEADLCTHLDPGNPAGRCSGLYHLRGRNLLSSNCFRVASRSSGLEPSRYGSGHLIIRLLLLIFGNHRHAMIGQVRDIWIKGFLFNSL